MDGGRHPGPFERVDLETAGDASRLFDAKSNKIHREDVLDPRLDKSEKILNKDPGSPVGRGENAVKRQAPFAYVDDVKAAARLFKAALLDINVPDLSAPKPIKALQGAEMAQSLQKAVEAPRLGDLAGQQPEPPEVELTAQRKPARSKAASPIPGLPISPGEADEGLKMKVDEPEELETARQRPLANQQVRSSVSLPRKSASFLSRFLRAGYGR